MSGMHEGAEFSPIDITAAAGRFNEGVAVGDRSSAVYAGDRCDGAGVCKGPGVHAVDDRRC